MAGGMGGRDGPRETLAERTANTRARAGHSTQDFHGKRPADWATPLHERPEPVTPPPVLKHCWYAGPHGRQAALLLRWRKVEDGFDGLIVVAAPDEAGLNWAVTEMWVESSMLAPA